MADATPLGFLEKEHRADDEGGILLPNERYAYSGDEMLPSVGLKPGVRPEDSFVLHRQSPDKSYHFAYVAPGQAHQQQKEGDVVTGELW